MSVNIALVRFIFPRASLGVGVGAMSLVVAAASVAGPSLASAILALAHWPWLFLINLPLGLLACVLTFRFLPMTPASGGRIDLWSIVLNALTFGPLIAGLAEWGHDRGSAPAAVLTGIGLTFGVCFVLYEKRLAQPLLPLDLLRRPVYALSLATSMSSFAAQTLGMLALPFYFERELGLSESATGLLMTPWPLATALVAPLAGHLSDRYRPERISTVGLLIMGTGLAALTQLDAGATTFDIAWRVALCGLGFGTFQSPNNRVIIENAPRERSGAAAGLQSVGRTLGQSVGAVIVALVFSAGGIHPTAWMCGLGAGLSLLACVASGFRRGV
jgi:DHA2 family multidrug resistance protein-like MFS transporter